MLRLRGCSSRCARARARFVFSFLLRGYVEIFVHIPVEHNNGDVGKAPSGPVDLHGLPGFVNKLNYTYRQGMDLCAYRQTVLSIDNPNGRG